MFGDVRAGSVGTIPTRRSPSGVFFSTSAVRTRITGEAAPFSLQAVVCGKGGAYAVPRVLQLNFEEFRLIYRIDRANVALVTLPRITFSSSFFSCSRNFSRLNDKNNNNNNFGLTPTTKYLKRVINKYFSFFNEYNCRNVLV